MIRRSLRKISVAASFSSLAYGSMGGLAASADLELLSRLLAPADLMLMVGNVCASQDSDFLTDTAGRRGNLRFYAQEVKDEVSENLSDNDVSLVLKQAADIAKAKALNAVRRLQSFDPVLEFQITKTWCDTTIKTLVGDYVRTHDERHAAFKELVRRAKAGSASE